VLTLYVLSQKHFQFPTSKIQPLQCEARRLSIWHRPTAAVPNFLHAGPNSRSYQHLWAGVFMYWKKQQKTTHITLVTFVYSCLFSMLRNLFAMWLMKLLRFLHTPNSYNIWCHAWCCNTESNVQMCIWNSVSTLRLIILHLRKDLFAKISTSKQTNQFLSTFRNLAFGRHSL